jgi:hypothetical protein
MGQDFKGCWFSAWPAIGEAFERARAVETAFLVDRRMFLDRHGYLEETFFTLLAAGRGGARPPSHAGG